MVGPSVVKEVVSPAFLSTAGLTELAKVIIAPNSRTVKKPERVTQRQPSMGVTPMVAAVMLILRVSEPPMAKLIV